MALAALAAVPVSWRWALNASTLFWIRRPIDHLSLMIWCFGPERLHVAPCYKRLDRPFCGLLEEEVLGLDIRAVRTSTAAGYGSGEAGGAGFRQASCRSGV